MVKTSNKKVITFISLGIFTAVIAGCSTPTASNLPTIYKNKIQLAESIERLELYTRPTGLELSARDQAAVGQFLQSYGQRGEGPLYVNLPSTTAQGLGSQQAQAVIRQAMAKVGLAGAAVQTGQYQAVEGSPAPVVVSYRTLRTVPEDCRTSGDLIDSYNNQAYDSFGCFHTANLAAMIGDPRQLIAPYEMGVPDSQRRQTVYDRYIQGESPASEQPARQDISVDE